MGKNKQLSRFPNAITLDSNLNATLVGSLTLAKVSGISSIHFPVGTSDAGFIKHDESTSDVGKMLFSVSDNDVATDYFAFGNTYLGTFNERFKITALGGIDGTTATFTSAGTLGSVRQVNITDGSKYLRLGVSASGGDIQSTGGVPLYINNAGNAIFMGDALTGTTATMGPAKMGEWAATGYAAFGHSTHYNSATSYALIQSSTGETILNSNVTLYLRTGGTSRLDLTSSSATLSVPLTGTSVTFSDVVVTNNRFINNGNLGATSWTTNSLSLGHNQSGGYSWIASGGASDLTHLVLNYSTVGNVIIGSTTNVGTNRLQVTGSSYFNGTVALVTPTGTNTTFLTLGTGSGAGYSRMVLTTGNGGGQTSFGVASSGGSSGDVTGTGVYSTWLSTLTNTNLEFGTAAQIRGMFSAAGFFKASNTNTYISSTGTYHELYSNVGDWNTRVTCSNASPFGIIITYNTASPNGVGNYFIYAQDNTTVRFTAKSDGGIQNYAGNNVNLSDERTKKDISLTSSMWNTIKALEVVDFKYKDQTHDDFNLGLIAQQVYSVAPRFVDIDGFGDTPEDGIPLMSIYDTDIQYGTLKVVQELQARVEQLETELQLLRNN